MSDLRARLAEGPILCAPGVGDALGARLVERAGFEAVYFSGAAVSYGLLAQPDVGLVTRTEMTDRLGHVVRAVSVPVIADGDDGYGEAPHVHHTVRRYEQAGAAAIQLEDQQHPKRCGHLAGKRLISTNAMCGKLGAALDARGGEGFLVIARTDARGPHGLDAALERAHAYAEAGADLVFVEAPESHQELEEVPRRLPGVALVANMVEGGKTPLVTNEELDSMGYRVVLYPNTLVRRFARAASALLSDLRERGTTAHRLDDLVLFDELNDLLGRQAFEHLERRFPHTHEPGNGEP